FQAMVEKVGGLRESDLPNDSWDMVRTNLCYHFFFREGRCPYWKNCIYLHANLETLRKAFRQYRCRCGKNGGICAYKCTYAHSAGQLTIPDELFTPGFPLSQGRQKARELSWMNDAGELQGKFRIWEMYIADTTGKNENRLCSDTLCTQAKCKKGVHILPEGWEWLRLEAAESGRELPDAPVYFPDARDKDKSKMVKASRWNEGRPNISQACEPDRFGKSGQLVQEAVGGPSRVHQGAEKARPGPAAPLTNPPRSGAEPASALELTNFPTLPTRRPEPVPPLQKKTGTQNKEVKADDGADVRSTSWYSHYRHTVFTFLRCCMLDDRAAGVNLLGIQPSADSKWTCKEWPAIQEDVHTYHEKKKMPFFNCRGDLQIKFESVVAKRVVAENLREQLEFYTRNRWFAVTWM
ncbi:UVR8, partial [Symbiodinium pilosum]